MKGQCIDSFEISCSGWGGKRLLCGSSARKREAAVKRSTASSVTVKAGRPDRSWENTDEIVCDRLTAFVYNSSKSSMKNVSVLLYIR